MIINYIIPLCKNVAQDDAQDRLDNLNSIITRSLARQSCCTVRLILIEQITEDNGEAYFLPRVDRTTKLEIVSQTVRYPIFVKGWLYNIGAHMVDGEHLVMGESDCICLEDAMMPLVRQVEDKNVPWMVGWSKLYYTNQNEKRAFLAGGTLRFERNEGITPRKFKAEGGLVYFKKDFFQSLGGYSEWLVELGGPDNDIAFRARWFSGKYESFNCRIYHLWHEYIKVLERKTRIQNLEKLKYMYENPKKICRGFRALRGLTGRNVPMCELIDYWKWVQAL